MESKLGKMGVLMIELLVIVKDKLVITYRLIKVILASLIFPIFHQKIINFLLKNYRIQEKFEAYKKI